MTDPMVAIRRVLERERFCKDVGDGALSETILSVVEPIIRTDEQMQAEPINQAWRDKMEAQIRADERERVANAMHGLSTDGAGWVLLRDVWATITRLGGESDG